jgi:hypothetical protein
MSELLGTITEDATSREACVCCEHGEVVAVDQGPLWTEDQLLDFASGVLSAYGHCTCFGERVWFPPRRPEHVTVTTRLFEQPERDAEIETVRPSHIPGLAVSLAANRVFETRQADDHPLAQDLALVRWWINQRQLGLLP